MRERARDARRRARRAPAAGRPGRASPRPRALLEWMDERPLHVPRLPRVRAGQRGRARTCSAPCRARVSASSATRRAAGSRRASRSCRPRCGGSRARPSLLNLTKANSPRDRAPALVPRLRRREALRRGRRGGRRAPLPRPLHAHGVQREPVGDPGAPPQGAAGRRARRASATGSHDHKALVEILETYPRDELFQISEDELFEIALGILHLGERQRVRLFVRRDVFGRFVSCLVYLPRDRFDTETGGGSRTILQRGVRRRRASTTRRASRSPCSRACTSWSAPSQERARRRRRRDRGAARGRRPARGRTTSTTRSSSSSARSGRRRSSSATATPSRRRTGTTSPPARPCSTSTRIERLDPDGDLGMSLYRAARVARRPPRVQAAPLGRADPALGRAAAAREHGRQGHRRAAVRDHAARGAAGLDLRLRAPPRRRTPSSTVDDVRETFQDAFARAWRGEAENDGFNRLVLGAAALARDRRAARDREVPAPGREHLQPGVHGGGARRAPGIARLLVELFRAALRPGAVRATTDAKARELEREIEAAIDAVASLDEDRILRSFLARRPRDAADELLPAGRRRQRRSRTSRSSSTRPRSPTCRRRGRCSRSSSTRRASRACTCAAARSRAAASAGRTGARTSAPRSSG